MSLKKTFESIVRAASEDLLKAVKQASVQELTGVIGNVKAKRSAKAEPAEPSSKKADKKSSKAKPGKSKKFERRASDSVHEVRALAVQYVIDNAKPTGLAISEIGKGLKLSTDELVLPLRHALQEGELHKTGTKRATRYYPPKKSSKEDGGDE